MRGPKHGLDGRRHGQGPHRTHGLLPGEIVVRVRGRIGERRHRRGIGGTPGQLADHPFPVPQVRIAHELRRQPRRGLVKGQLLEHVIAVVEDHHRRGAAHAGHRDRLASRVERRVVHDVAARRPDPNGEGHAEDFGHLEPDTVRAGLEGIELRLADVEAQRVGGAVVRSGHVELRVARRVHPLAPEPVEVLARCLEHGLAQVVRGGVPERVAHEIRVQRRPEAFRSEVVLQHPEHQRALRVDVVRSLRGERHRVPRVDGHVLLVFVVVVVLGRMLAARAQPVLPRHELGEPFVEPEVGPVFGGHVVAEPLMGEFVRDEQLQVPGPVLIGARVGQPIHQRGGAHVLHAAEEVGHRGLRILVPGIRHPGQRRVRIDHVRGVMEQPPGVGAVGMVHVVVHRHTLPGVVDLRERADDERHEIGGRRAVFTPRHGVRGAVANVGDEPPVGDHDVAAIHGRHEFPRFLVVGKIVGREPVVVVHGLALAPDLARAMGEPVGRNVGQATTVGHAPVVRYGEPERVAEPHRGRREDHERVAMAGRADQSAMRPRHLGVLQ